MGFFISLILTVSAVSAFLVVLGEMNGLTFGYIMAIILIVLEIILYIKTGFIF